MGGEKLYFNVSFYLKMYDFVIKYTSYVTLHLRTPLPEVFLRKSCANVSDFALFFLVLKNSKPNKTLLTFYVEFILH